MTISTSVIGTLVSDRYRLEEKIGSGGMSTVYRAFDPTLERWVAIKLMHRDISTDPDQLERFRREARAVARLNHQHVVTVIDAGEDDGAPYIVFEYVEGETLKGRIKRLGRLPVSEAVAYAIEIGRGLSCAHSNRLVHRDVKPQNVLIDQDGRAKVTDFGIARSLESRRPDGDGARARHHRLRVARAGDGPGRDRAVGHLLARDLPLRDAHRRGPVPGRHAGRGGDEARAGADAGRAAPPPRDLSRAGGGAGALDRQGAAPPLRDRRRRWSTTSSRCWPSRPRARARRRARPPRSCARCRATPATSSPAACVTRGGRCSRRCS